jgi:acetylornithine/succinyldiaminopimelate/putrescine aminotransferase
LIALEFENSQVAKIVVDKCIQAGVLTDWFLFAPNCMRIAPPLTIDEKEITAACVSILKALDAL